MVHNLTNVFTGQEGRTYQRGGKDMNIEIPLSEIVKLDLKDLARTCDMILADFKDGKDQLNMFNDAVQQIEKLRSVVSYCRKQAIYQYVETYGHGSMTDAAKELNISKQRVHDLYHEAKEERLKLVTGEKIADRL
jgi:hypothetical protein|tara:strand:+ start:407 stop:811 length:405 start_codon:yes stop_codon:yes gene_type:complete